MILTYQIGIKKVTVHCRCYIIRRCCLDGLVATDPPWQHAIVHLGPSPPASNAKTPMTPARIATG
ncbi:MAG: hypothetical protein VCB79_11190, partial [Dehalococcoidia bacterium]